ncbi:MAG: hypothetical protein R3C26_01740 [Calditrichia bacterium]
MPQIPVFEEIIDTRKMITHRWKASVGFHPPIPDFGAARLRNSTAKAMAAITRCFARICRRRRLIQVYAWWVASSIAADTPVLVRHANGTDTVQVDQTGSTAQWNLILANTALAAHPRTK